MKWMFQIHVKSQYRSINMESKTTQARQKALEPTVWESHSRLGFTNAESLRGESCSWCKESQKEEDKLGHFLFLLLIVGYNYYNWSFFFVSVLTMMDDGWRCRTIAIFREFLCDGWGFFFERCLFCPSYVSHSTKSTGKAGPSDWETWRCKPSVFCSRGLLGVYSVQWVDDVRQSVFAQISWAPISISVHPSQVELQNLQHYRRSHNDHFLSLQVNNRLCASIQELWLCTSPLVAPLRFHLLVSWLAKDRDATVFLL